MYVDRFGLDPEVAIVSKKTGKGRSAHLFPYVEEKKTFTFHLEDGSESQDGAEVERDGAAIELRSIAPTACRDNFIPYLAEGMRQTFLQLQEWNNKFTLSSTPKFELDSTSFKGDVPEDVSEFGCRPDMDAYALKPKDPVCAAADRRRWTGGHIHVSTPGMKNFGQDVHLQAACAILFDYFVALPMVAILGEKFAEGEAERRTMYGQPGSFRFDASLKKIEFRTLSGRLLLSPILLYWATGMVKSMFVEMGADVKDTLARMNTVVSAKDVHDVVLNHDVAGAEFLAPRIFENMRTYTENTSVLANPVSGGGSGTSAPFFFRRAFDVFVEANREGLTWDDDLQRNWGLYEDYEPRHHSYWGIQQAMVGLCDEDIFPQRPILSKVWEPEFVSENPIYTHPLNGGAMEWTTSGAPNWLL